MERGHSRLSDASCGDTTFRNLSFCIVSASLKILLQHTTESSYLCLLRRIDADRYLRNPVSSASPGWTSAGPPRLQVVAELMEQLAAHLPRHWRVERALQRQRQLELTVPSRARRMRGPLGNVCGTCNTKNSSRTLHVWASNSSESYELNDQLGQGRLTRPSKAI